MAQDRVSFSIVLDGAAYPGTYAVEGDLVDVTSVYGAKIAPMRRMRASSVAKALLAELIYEWQLARAARPILRDAAGDPEPGSRQ